MQDRYAGWAVPKQHALCFSCTNYLSAGKVFITAPVPQYQKIACFKANLSSHLFKRHVLYLNFCGQHLSSSPGEAVLLQTVCMHVGSHNRCYFKRSLPSRVRTRSSPGEALSSSPCKPSLAWLLQQAPAHAACWLWQLPVFSRATGWLVPVARFGGKIKQGMCPWFQGLWGGFPPA